MKKVLISSLVFFSLISGIAHAEDNEVNQPDTIESYTESIKKEPNNPDFYFQRAKLYFYNNDFENAINDINTSIEKNSKNVEYYKLRALIYSVNNDYLNSMNDYKKILEFEPNNKEIVTKLLGIYVDLSNNYEIKSQFDESIDYINKAIELNPKDYLLFVDRQRFYYEKTKDPYKSIDECIKIIQTDISLTVLVKDYLEKYFINILDNSNELKDLSQLENIIKPYSGNKDVLQKVALSLISVADKEQSQAQIYLKSKQVEKGIDSFQRAIFVMSLLTNLDKGFAKKMNELYIGYTMMGNLYTENKNYDKALKSFNLSLKYNPKYSSAYSGLGYLYLSQNNFIESEKYLNQSLKLDLKNSAAYYNFSRLYAKLNKKELAIKNLNKSISMDKKYLSYSKSDKNFENIKNTTEFKKLTGKK